MTLSGPMEYKYTGFQIALIWNKYSGTIQQ